MNTFTYSYPVKVYFGEKAAADNLPAELAKVGKMCCSHTVAAQSRGQAFMMSLWAY